MSASATTVFLVRHGSHDLLGHRVAGRMDGVPLNADGRGEAARMAARLSREPVAALVSSPLQRARETAEPIAAALGLPVAIDEAINEVDFGEWTGLDLASLDEDERWRAWNRHRSTARVPGGETMSEVAERAAAAVEGWRLRFPGRSVVATSHGDVIRGLVCRLLGLSYDRIHAFDVSPGSLTTIVVWERDGKVLALNEAAA